MPTIYDRIDVKVTGTWYKNFRPNGLVLSFGTNLAGSESFGSLTGGSGVILPYGTIIGGVSKPQETVVNYIVNKLGLPKTTDGLQMSGVVATATGVSFPASTIFDSKVFPVGIVNPGTNSLPDGAIISCHLAAVAYSNVTLSATNLCGGISTIGGIKFASNVQLTDVYIPFGTKFSTALTIGGKGFAAGTLKVAPQDQFSMQTVQLVDSTLKAVLSVHDVATDETLAFNRMTADVYRLLMYRLGVGIDSTTYACYGITFKTTITLADITAFNKLHPGDVNPIIIDDGTIVDPNYIIPQA